MDNKNTTYQKKEIDRVKDEIKWYLGEELNRDPSLSKEDMKIVRVRLSNIILSGFGEYLSTLINKSGSI